MARRKHYLDSVEREVTDYRLTENGDWTGITADGRTRSELIEEAAEDKSRLDSISNVYQTADKIITSEDISVTVVRDSSMETTAMNNGREIIYNASLIEDLDVETIVSMNGTNYHELAHILYSPRAGSALGQHVNKYQMRRAYNMLEEARIERLVVAKYPATRLSLEAMVLEYALKGDPETWADTFPVITARRYLDIELRQMIADRFINKYGAELAQQVNKIVTEYSTLSFPKDFTRGIELISEYSNLVGTDNTNPKDYPVPSAGDGHNHFDRPVPNKGRPAGGKEQERLQQKAGSGGDSENLTGDNRSDGENDKDGTNPNYGVGGDGGEVIVAQKRYDQDDERIAKLLSDRMRDIHNDSRIKSEVRDIRKAINGNEDVRGTLKNSKFILTPVRGGAASFAKRFGMTLERMVRDSDPKWERDMPYGKLNVGRTMTPDINVIDRVFDRWDTGSSNTDIEAVMLLDNSGSMGHFMTEVCENAWIIKRGIEAINGNVTVYNFNSVSELLYDKSDKAKPSNYRSIYSTGSTNPLTALVEAERILTTTDKPIKMLYIVTDGAWEYSTDCDVIINRLNKRGVLTCVVFMGDYTYVNQALVEARRGSKEHLQFIKALRHGATIFKAVASPKDVLQLAVDVVKSNIGK